MLRWHTVGVEVRLAKWQRPGTRAPASLGIDRQGEYTHVIDVAIGVLTDERGA